MVDIIRMKKLGAMSLSVSEREKLWDEFLERWPLSSLSTMTLAEYSSAGNDDCFMYWLESRTDELGSIWGGSAFKFGIYSRKDKEQKPSERGRTYDDDYAWYSKYGNSAQEAFEKVRSHIVAAANAAANGNFEEIEKIDLGPAVKWKVAFLYQDRNQPKLLPVYRPEILAAYMGSKPGGSMLDLQSEVLAQQGDANILEFGERVWTKASEVLGEVKAGGDDEESIDQPSSSPAGSPVQNSEGTSARKSASAIPLNQIFYGPPGTGKTFTTVNHALAILDPEFLQANAENDPEARSRLKARFDALVQEDRIRFVTFHQSFSYEDFVEGLKATVDESSGKLNYEVVDGVFKSLCELAAAKVTQKSQPPAQIGNRRVWKMSLGNTQGEDSNVVFQECMENGYILLGWGGGVDFSGCSSREDVQARFSQAGYKPDNPGTDYGITSVTTFVTKMKAGDLVVVSDGNFKFRAIGEVTGDYQFRLHPEFGADFAQMRPVKWLRQYSPSLPHTQLLNGQFSQMTLYELRSPTLDRGKLEKLLHTDSVEGVFTVGQVFGRDYQVVRVSSELLELKKPNGNILPFSMNLLHELANEVRRGRIALQDIRDRTAMQKLQGSQLEPYIVNGYSNILPLLVEHLIGGAKPSASMASTHDARVLIIDEINRGNVSRIFGELITLIEPSKRAGAEEALSVVLPYSKKRFSVPNNLYLIGTMNTADRSLAGLDIALRRRFVFHEMPPMPELLDDVEVEGINIGQLLRVMNSRIEVLLDRDHRLGHAYFMPLKTDRTLHRLELIFRNQIIPLLQEYFFEDWERISWVLNDHQAPMRRTEPFCRRPFDDQSLHALFGIVAEQLSDRRWELNERAFKSPDSYRNILGW